jgi:hypothetical protein
MEVPGNFLPGQAFAKARLTLNLVRIYSFIKIPCPAQYALCTRLSPWYSFVREFVSRHLDAPLVDRFAVADVDVVYFHDGVHHYY